MSSRSVEGRTWAPVEGHWHDLASDRDTTTFNESVAPPPSSFLSESAWSQVLLNVQQWLAFFRGLTLAAGSAVSCSFAAGGLAVMLFLAVTLSFAPASDTYSRRLDLDITSADLAGQAVFLPEAQVADGLLPANPDQDRFLPPLQPVDVWVELEVPRSAGQGVAHVVAQLTSLDGRPAAKASRALMLRTDPWTLSSAASAPLRWLGLAPDTRLLRVPLFRNYREKREVPFMAAHLAIKTRTPGWSAEVLSATVVVRLRLGLLRRALYLLRPGPLALLLVGSSALAAFLGGGAAALVCLALLLYAGLGGGGGEAVVEDEVSSNVSGDVEVSSASDVSEASSSMLREVEQEGEPPSPRHHPGMRSPGSATAAGRAQPKAAGRLADSAMGSEAGAAQRGAGLLRRRAGNLGL